MLQALGGLTGLSPKPYKSKTLNPKCILALCLDKQLLVIS